MRLLLMPRRRLAMASDTGKSKHFLQQEGADEHHEIAWQIEVSPACDGMYLSDQLCSPRARALANYESLLQAGFAFLQRADGDRGWLVRFHLRLINTEHCSSCLTNKTIKQGSVLQSLDHIRQGMIGNR